MIEWLKFSAKAIKNFPMGDPHERCFPVYLPPDYSEKRADPYPVIFMLAGFASRSAKYVWQESVYTPALPLQLDQAIINKQLPPMIMVFPDGSSRLGGSQYINSPALGNYQDYIADEVVTLIDNQFHTHASENFRGVLGHSSGGYGALLLGMQRPDRFRFICSSAGDGFFEVSILPFVNQAVYQLEKAGGVDAFTHWFFHEPTAMSQGSAVFHTMLTLALAPCFAPNLQAAPLYGDLFFDLKTGAIREAVWERYLAWDPVRLVEKSLSQLRELKWLHLACGLQDEYAAQWAHRQLSAKLQQHQIAHHLEEYPGTHLGHEWRHIERLRLMLQKMS